MFSLFRKKKVEKPREYKEYKTIESSFQVDYLNDHIRDGQYFTACEKSVGHYCKGRKIFVYCWRIY